MSHQGIASASDIVAETSGVSHQEERSSLTIVIRSQIEVESHRRAEEHQSVIILDYIFLTNPHHSLQTTSEQCRHDIARRVSSNIRQPESSSRDPAYQWVISLSVIVEHISVILVTKGGHLVLVFIISSAVILLHQHQVWPIHSGCLLAFHLCLHLLLVHLAHLSVLGRPQPHHLEDRDRPPQFCGVHHCRMFLLALHLALHLSHLHHGFHLQPASLPQSHLEPHHFINFMLCNTDYLNIILEIFNINNYYTRHTSFFKHIMLNSVYFNYIDYILTSYLDIKNSIQPTTTVIQIILLSYMTTFNSSISYILLLISDLNSMQLIKSIHQHILSIIPTLKLRGEETA